MLDIERTLGRGYPTPEEAIGPLREAKPDLPRMTGYLGLPSSDVTYRMGGGRGIVVLPVKVFVTAEGGLYSISVRINRIPPILIFAAVLGDCFLIFVSLGMLNRLTLGPLLFLLASWLVVHAFFLAQYFSVARKALSEFSSCYPRNEG
jgi:hypothetical protein